MHICQISKHDEDLLAWDLNSESVNRQKGYYDILKSECYGSTMTIFVLYKSKKIYKCHSYEGITIFPIFNNYYNRFLGIFFILLHYNWRHPISLITTQAVYDEAWPALFFSKYLKIPIIGQIHFDIFDKQAIKDNLGLGFIGNLRFYLFKKLIKYFTAVRVVGKRIEIKLLELNLVDQKRIYILPVTVPLVNTVHENNYITPFKSTKKKILFVGRLVNQKNLFFFIEIAKDVIEKNNDIEFYIIGSGVLEKQLKEYTKKMEIEDNIFFLGEVKNQDLSNYYSNSDLFLLTSFYEGFGRVILEAGSFGLPVISSKVTGPEDIINHGINGYLFDLGKKVDFVNCIINLLNDEETRKKLGEANKQLIKSKFDSEVLKNNWVKLWLKL
jgi:glycosyltransferase involved in cell wall biosynthesis